MNRFFQFTPQLKNHFQIKNPSLPMASVFNKEDSLHDSLEKNLNLFKRIFHFPSASDFIIREFSITINDQIYSSCLLFYDGMVDGNSINISILKPLMMPLKFENHHLLKKLPEEEILPHLLDSTLSHCQLQTKQKVYEVVDSMNHGDCVLLIDGISKAIIIDVKKIPTRSINKSENEMTIKGPSESFVETLRTNTALIRKFVKDENLIFETVEVGQKSKTKCTIAYISTITNDSILHEVKRRIQSLQIDYLIDIGELEQLIEDKTYLLDPLTLSTERPDKVASGLWEGRVAILLEGSPNALLVPAVFTDFTHSPEDTYMRHPYAMLLRIFRLPAIFLSIFLPGIYIAITTFHQEMIPTDLLLAIAGTREKVPFPMLIELLIMETAFEIIREASIRTPAPVRSNTRNCWHFNSGAGHRQC